jgi:prepilin-type N-terminal cleavage/methylation domain-containing protein
MTYHRVKFRRKRAFAFTLVEIMIVVAVIALLAVIALPVSCVLVSAHKQHR